MSDDIAVITFPERSTTYEAFSKISADSDRLGLVSAALIEVDEHGRFTIPEGEDNRFGFGVGTGSLIGVLVGPWAGPSECSWVWGSVPSPVPPSTPTGPRAMSSP